MFFQAQTYGSGRKDYPQVNDSAVCWEGSASWYIPCKIILEFTAAAFLLVLTAPVILLIALLIKLTSRGPALYMQTRLGRFGRPYSIYKLRTMTHNCESKSGPQWATADDRRVTRLGRFLRFAHLDELPQLWNVLKGDMSLIGPRPERPEFIPALERAIPHYRQRLLVRPGITGLAQIQLPADSNLESVRRKLAYDLFYVRRVNFWLDLRILLGTLFKVAGIPFPVLRRLFLIPRVEVIEDAYQNLSERQEVLCLSRPNGDHATRTKAELIPASFLPNVLFLAHRVPYPPDKGDRIRSFNLLRFLSRRARVHLACLADEPVEEETMLALRSYCARVAIVPVGGKSRWLRASFSLARGRTASEGAFDIPELRAVVSSWAFETRFDVTLASASSIAPYLRLEELRDIPAVLDLMDVDSQKWFDYAATRRGPRAWLYRTEGRRLRRLEQTLSGWARAITLVGEAEAAIFRQFCPDGPVHAITNGVDLDYFHPTLPTAGPSCVFVGALDYLPNVEGSVWFCREVWPKVLRCRPEAKFYLVGRRPSPAVQRLGELPGVELVGQVPDVRPYVAGATVTVVPLRIARGVQNKVLESLAMARPTIASPQTLAGLKAQPGVHLLQASSHEEWLQAILALFVDPALGRQLGEAGRRYVEEHHCWERCLLPFAPLLGLRAEVAPSSRRPRHDPSVGHGSHLAADRKHRQEKTAVGYQRSLTVFPPV